MFNTDNPTNLKYVFFRRKKKRETYLCYIFKRFSQVVIRVHYNHLDQSSMPSQPTLVQFNPYISCEYYNILIHS